MLLLLSFELPLLLRYLLPDELLFLSTGEVVLREVEIVVDLEVAVEVLGVATGTVSPLRFAVLTSCVLGRVLITFDELVVVRVPVERNDDSFRSTDSDWVRVEDVPRTVGVVLPFTTRTVRSDETTEFRVTVRVLPSTPPTRAVPPEIDCRVDPL